MPNKIILILIIFLNVAFVYSVIDVPSNVVVSGCGDGICNVNESCSNCKFDCGECFIPGGSGGGSSGGGGSDGGRKLPNDEIIDNKPTDGIVKCNEYWICEDWRECVNNEQKRSCYDFEKCNTTLYKPEERKECGQQAVLPALLVKESNLSFLIIFLMLILLLLTYFSIKKKKNRRRKRKYA